MKNYPDTDKKWLKKQEKVWQRIETQGILGIEEEEEDGNTS